MEDGGSIAPRVLVVTAFGTATGGAELWLHSILSHAQFDLLDLVMLEDGDLRAQLAPLVDSISIVPTGNSAAAITKASAQLFRILRRLRPDVVVSNGVKAQAVAVMPARALGIPSLWVKHDHSYDSSLARPVGRLTNTVVAASADLGAPVGRDVHSRSRATADRRATATC